jgi:uncharacterized protein DUF6328
MPTTQKLDLPDVVTYILEECRMVLPGIQALFGFQLIAVFNQRFESLPFRYQAAHLSATGLSALAAAFVMTPAAYHRREEPHIVSERFVEISTRLLLVSMLCLAAGVSTDFFVICAMILTHPMVAAVLSISLFAILMMLWFVFPRRAPSRGNGQPPP